MSNAAPVSSPAPSQTTTPLSRNGGFSLLALLATIIITPTLCLGALQFGAHIALGIERFTPNLSRSFTRRFLDRCIVPLALLSWLGAVLMAIFPPDRPGQPIPPASSSWAAETWRGSVIFALVFAPIGCLVRFYVSLKLNFRIPTFPLGTFVVNIFGTLCIAVFYDLQRVPLTDGLSGGGKISCQILGGLMDGFCGCLTTISTWVAELKGLRRMHAYRYGMFSILGGLAITTIVMGSVLWTKDFSPISCG